MKKLTNKQKKSYLKNNYGSCPKCKSNDIEGSSVEIDGKETYQEVRCLECDLAWRDIYTLSNIEVID